MENSIAKANTVSLSGDAQLENVVDAPRADVPPGYVVLGELGRGGMGVVYRVRQTSLDRVVALKMILVGKNAGDEVIGRFKSEAESIARLQHPNVVQIYDVGEHDGNPWFTMEFVEGGDLGSKLRGTPMPQRGAAQLAWTLAGALEAMHAKNIVHRDLKPANILIAADGMPKVMDFGLAKQTDRTSDLTNTGAIVGTPSYMAPEQAASHKSLGPATDVYALGAVLYEALTGRPPFRAATPLDTLMQVIHNDPVPVRLLNPKIDRDLETICMQCLEKEPTRRYPHARALAEDLRRYLSGETISASNRSLMDRLSRSFERGQFDPKHQAWARVLFCWAAIVFGVEATLYFVIASKLAETWVNVTQATQPVLMAATLLCFIRPSRLRPENSSERYLWSLWLGHCVACILVALVSKSLLGLEKMYEFFLYPYWSLVSGLAFIVMGGSHWSWAYAFGSAFFAAALALPYAPAAGPWVFGGLWALCLVAFGVRLQRLAGASELSK